MAKRKGCDIKDCQNEYFWDPMICRCKPCTECDKSKPEDFVCQQACLNDKTSTSTTKTTSEVVATGSFLYPVSSENASHVPSTVLIYLTLVICIVSLLTTLLSWCFICKYKRKYKKKFRDIESMLQCDRETANLSQSEIKDSGKSNSALNLGVLNGIIARIKDIWKCHSCTEPSHGETSIKHNAKEKRPGCCCFGHSQICYSSKGIEVDQNKTLDAAISGLSYKTPTRTDTINNPENVTFNKEKCEVQVHTSIKGEDSNVTSSINKDKDEDQTSSVSRHQPDGSEISLELSHDDHEVFTHNEHDVVTRVTEEANNTSSRKSKSFSSRRSQLSSSEFTQDTNIAIRNEHKDDPNAVKSVQAVIEDRPPVEEEAGIEDSITTIKRVHSTEEESPLLKEDNIYSQTGAYSIINTNKSSMSDAAKTTVQRNKDLYPVLRGLPWVLGYFSEGKSIEVYVDFDEMSPEEALELLVKETGQPREKYHVKQNEY